MLPLLHRHMASLITPRKGGSQNSAGFDPGSCGPTAPWAPGHVVYMKSILLGVGEKAEGKSSFSPQPCRRLVVSSEPLVGNELCPPPTPCSEFKEKIKGLRKHQRQALFYDSIRQLFQNILDLVFIVEHTYQGKVLHTQLQIILEGKSCKKKCNCLSYAVPT